MNRSRHMLAIVAMALALPAVLLGCTDGMKTLEEARERPLHVTCYSGGVVIVDDYSVQDVNWGGAGIYYRSRTTMRLVKAGADCILVDEPTPTGWKPLLPGRTR